jgi:hypothetical protein
MIKYIKFPSLAPNDGGGDMPDTSSSDGSDDGHDTPSQP